MKHKHLLINSTFESTPFKDIDFTNKWLLNIVNLIDMEVLHEPVSVKCNQQDNEGISAFCLITTSHICLHSWEKTDPNVVQLDIYSCKNFQIQTILDQINNFSPIDVKYKFLDRNKFDANIL